MPGRHLDMDALRAHAGRIVPAVGINWCGSLCYEITVTLGHKLDRHVIEFPGGHLGYLAHPAAFAQRLTSAYRHRETTPAPRRQPR